METLLLHHIQPTDFADLDFAALYEERKREANFAAVFQVGDCTYALRDHIGLVPLFYRKATEGWRFSTNLTDLVQPQDTLDEAGLRYYLGFGSCTIIPLFREIGIVPPGATIRFPAANHSADHPPELVYQYRIQPQRIPFTRRCSALLYTLRDLLQKALHRCALSDDIGLLLSGGIDSFLVGALLKEAGHPFRSYTTARWGENSSEYEYATACARVLATEHTIDELKTENYDSLFRQLPDFYRLPHASPTGLGVLSLAQNTSLMQHSVLLNGVLVDTYTSATPEIHLTFFSPYFPSFLRSRHDLPYSDSIANLAHFRSKGIVKNIDPIYQTCAAHQGLARHVIACLLATNGANMIEPMLQPLLNARIPLTSPFFDMDVIEFCLGVPMWHSIRWRRAMMPITLDKTLFRLLAREYDYPLPIHLKKGFHIPLERDEAARRFNAQLPSHWNGIRLVNEEHRFAAASLLEWGHQLGMEFVKTVSLAA